MLTKQDNVYVIGQWDHDEEEASEKIFLPAAFELGNKIALYAYLNQEDIPWDDYKDFETSRCSLEDTMYSMMAIKEILKKDVLLILNPDKDETILTLDEVKSL